MIYKDIDGILFSKDGTLLHTYPVGKSAASYEIPSGVTGIGVGAFAECNSLTSIELPAGVTSIGNSAFYGCSKLTSITLSPSVTSIDAGAFENLAANSIIYCTDTSLLSGYYYNSKYTPRTTALAVKNSDGSYTFTSSIPALVLSEANAPSGVTYDGWFAESTFTTPVTSIAAGTNPTLWLKGDSIPTETYYTITITPSIGGSAFASPESAAAGSIISLTATPETGYVFTEWQVLSGGDIYITDGMFIMPDCDVEIQAVFEEAGDGIVDFGTCGAQGDNLQWTLYENGTLIISGTGDMADYLMFMGVADSHKDSIESCIITEGATSVGDYAFSGYSALSSVTLPSSLVTIGEGSFSNCYGLTSVNLPESLTSIGHEAFSGCSGLTAAVTVPNGITKIENGVFAGCSGLTSITLPEGITSIGEVAFSGCSNLASLELPEGVVRIGGGAFAVCSNLSSLVIPSTVTSIGNAAFQDCIGLTSMRIPAGVTDIADFVFGGCSNLEEILVDSANPAYMSNDGVLFSKDGTAILCYPAGKPDVMYVVPQGVTVVGNASFMFCNLDSITLPEGVTTIGEQAFYGCVWLSSFTLPSSVTYIGWNPFFNCDSLTSLTLLSPSVTIDATELLSSSMGVIYYSCAKSDLDSEAGGKYRYTVGIAYNNTDGSYTFTTKASDWQLSLTPANAPINDGMNFDGWYDNPEFEGDEVMYIEAGTAEKTLWIKWSIPDEYDITVFSTTGGSASSSVPSAEAGTLITLTPAEDTGYSFSTWQVLSGDVNIYDDQFSMPDSDVEIMAVFETDSLHLSSGWNFVSVPQKLSAAFDTAAELFAEVNSDGKAMLGYNAAASQWELVSGNTEIVPLNAYWIYSTEDKVITPVFDSGSSDVEDKLVYEGWNAVGICAEESLPAVSVFNGMNWSSYVSWDASAREYNPQITNGGTGEASDKKIVSRWNGGWVYVEENGVFQRCM